MFKDQFTLKKSSYPAKLMKYIWGLDPQDFSHMCPYFWLSLFNHFAILIVFPIKGGYRLLSYIFNLIGTIFIAFFSPLYKKIVKDMEIAARKRELKRRAQQAIKQGKEAAIYAKWAAYYKEHPEELFEIKKKKNSIYEDILDKIGKFHYEEYRQLKDDVYNIQEKFEDQEWIKEAQEAKQKAAEYLQKKKEEFLKVYTGDNTEALLVDGSFEDYLKNWQKQKKQRDIEAEAHRLRERKARINKILKITKPITALLAYALGTVVVIAGLYYGWMFIGWVWDGIQSVPHKNYVNIGEALGIVALLIIAAAILVFGIFFLRKWVLTLSLPPLPEWLRRKEKLLKQNSDYKNRVDKYEKDRKLRRKYIYNPIEKFLGFFIFIWEKGILRLFKSIKNAGEFLIQMLKNNCPAIKWED